VNLTTISSLIADEISPTLIATLIQDQGIYGEDRFGKVDFHDVDSLMVQGILDDLQTIALADWAGVGIDSDSAQEEGALWELFHFGWPREQVPNFKGYEASKAKELKARSRKKGETGLLMIIAGLLEFIEKGADLKTNHPDFKNRADLIDRLTDEDIRTGLSRRNLETQFAEAKRVWDRELQ
jgi:hypothetical protein